LAETKVFIKIKNNTFYIKALKTTFFTFKKWKKNKFYVAHVCTP
jgi:hypothetical protein